MTSKAVVTGAGGFIGRHLCRTLAMRGMAVQGIDVHYPEGEGPGDALPYHAVQGDFRDETTMRSLLDGAQVLYHLASAHLQISLPDEEYWNVNVHSVAGLLDRAKQAGVKRCVHVSSVGVFGDVGREAANEATAAHPQSIYGRTKLAGEQQALAHGEKIGLEVVAIRPAWVYGPGCPRTAKIYRALRKRRFIMIGRCDNLRHPIHIEDMLAAFDLAAAHDDAVGQCFIIAGDRAITTQELIDTFCKACDLPRPPVRIPYFAGVMLATAAEMAGSLLHREPPISRRTLEFFDTNNIFDIAKARSVLGFEPTVTFAEGMRKTRTWLESPTPGISDRHEAESPNRQKVER